MWRNRLLFIPVAWFMCLAWGFGSSNAKKIQEIDAQIEQLEAQRIGFEGKVLRHEYYAEYLQFNDQMTLEYRRHLQLAEENRAKAAYTQAKIDELKAQRAQLK